LRRVVPVSGEYAGGRFLIRRNGAVVATPLLAALVALEASDLVFALDSIPAVSAITRDTFIIVTSSAFAVLGLRAPYFLLAGSMQRFVRVAQWVSDHGAASPPRATTCRLHHITARGNNRRSIYEDLIDREHFYGILHAALRRRRRVERHADVLSGSRRSCRPASS
jgi:hypothetical protein